MKTVFISYAIEDSPWLSRILATLRSLELSGQVKFWYDWKIKDGVKWEDEIYLRMDTADAYLVLVSQNYLRPDKDFIRNKEFPRLKSHITDGRAHLFWLPIDVFPQDDAGEMAGFFLERQAAHDQRESLTQLLLDSRPSSTLDNVLLRVLAKVSRWLELSRSTVAERSKDADQTLAEIPESVEPAYLNDLSERLQWLSTSPLTGRNTSGKKLLRRIDLDRTYISLQADPTTIQQRLETRALHQELAEDEIEDERPDLSEDLRLKGPKDPVAEILAGHAGHMPASQHPQASEEISIEQAFRKKRALVILGDPGSGKSVLCRWIALRMARTLSALEAGGDTRTSDLGPARLPILIRVASFAQWIRENPHSPVDFTEFIKDHPEVWHGQDHPGASYVGRLCIKALENRQAVVLVDGLDEVVGLADRDKICNALEVFIARWILRSDRTSAVESLLQQGEPGETGGNQIVVTSRITGYHLAPLRLEVAEHFLIRPLNDRQVREFCHNIAAMLTDFARDASDVGKQFLGALASGRLRGLDRLIRNPLLLTSLVLYWYENRSLPSTRAELYRELISDLAGNWRLDQVQSEADGLKHGADELQSWLKDERHVFELLGTIAVLIHERYPTGRIPRSALVNQTKIAYANVAGKSGLEEESQAKVNEITRFLIELLSTQLGALVEVGSEVYSFIHLTFQEYLVGWKIVADAENRASESVEALVRSFEEKRDDPRWHEPLLFAFGELTAPNRSAGVERIHPVDFLCALRDLEAKRGFATESALFMADILSEADPNQIDQAQLEQVLWALLETYSACGPRPANRKRRQRIGDRVAELRRLNDQEQFKRRIDRLCLGALKESPALAPAVAHLFWIRRWLSRDTLLAFAQNLHRDSPVWGWPMHSALRMSLLPPEERTDPEPLIQLTRPPDDTPDREQLRYEAAYETWKRERQAYEEREIADFPVEAFALRVFFLEEPERWKHVVSTPAGLRLAIAWLGAVQDWQSLRWSEEYTEIAAFLQLPDNQREAQMDANPEAYIPRWGAVDTIYNAAVYLDTVGGKRAKRISSKPPELLPDWIACRPSGETEALLRRFGAGRPVGDELEASLTELLRSNVEQTKAEALIGLTALGLSCSEPSSELTWKLSQTLDLLRDGVARAQAQGENAWFRQTNTEGAKLSEAELCVCFRTIRAAVSHAASTALSDDLNVDRGELNALWKFGETYAKVFACVSDDNIYNFAVCLDTHAPQKEGWKRPLPALAAILMSAWARMWAGKVSSQFPILWGISPNERLYPPAFFESLSLLSMLAANLKLSFGGGFVELFLKPLTISGVEGVLKVVHQFILRSMADADGTLVFEGVPNVAEELNTETITATPTMWLLLDSFLGDHQIRNPEEVLRNDPDIFSAACATEHLLARGLLAYDGKGATLVDDLAIRLGKISALDGSLFLARQAQNCLDAKLKQRWLMDALESSPKISDLYERAEFLHRIGNIILDAYPQESIAVRYRELCEMIDSPILRAHAGRRLGRYMSHPDFPWNTPDALGLNPAWAATAVYTAILETYRRSAEPSQMLSAWTQLVETGFSLAAIDQLMELGMDGGLAATEEAVRIFEDVQKLDANLLAQHRPERLLSLLVRPSVKSQRRLEKWLAHESNGSHVSLPEVREQAAILLAEGRSELKVEWVEQLIQALRFGDDGPAGRALLCLTGPRLDVDRVNRRSSVKRNGIATLRYLSKKRVELKGHPGHEYLAYSIGVAINDWRMDEESALEEWCTAARTARDVRDELVECLDWCDVWTSSCQETLSRWVLDIDAEENTDTVLSFLQLAGRLATRHTTSLEPCLLEALHRFTDHAPSGNTVFPVAAGNTTRPNHLELLAAACEAASSMAVGARALRHAEDALKREMLPLLDGGGQVNGDGLRGLGTMCYYIIGEVPEDCMGLISSSLNSATFVGVMIDWLEQLLASWDTTTHRIERMVAKRKLEALLSFAVCLSIQSESTFAARCEPERFLRHLARVCVERPSRRSHMAAITLISRLKHVDLDVEVSPGFTVLQSLLGGLRDSPEVQSRLINTLPKIYRLRGKQILDSLERILLATGADHTNASQRLPAGSHVLGAAQLLLNLIREGVLDTAERVRAMKCLRAAAALPHHRRPLHRLVGLGTEKDPLTLVTTGDLVSELAYIASEV